MCLKQCRPGVLKLLFQSSSLLSDKGTILILFTSISLILSQITLYGFVFVYQINKLDPKILILDSFLVQIAP